MKLIVCVLLWFLTIVNSALLGPADITIENLSECEDPEQYEIKFPIKMIKVNRTQAGFTGCANITMDMGESTNLNLTAAKWGDGGWKPNAFNFYDKNACAVLEKYTKNPWEDIKKVIGQGETGCPLPKGYYCSDKLSLGLNGLFPSMLYGKFRVDTVFIWSDSLKMCIRAFINSTPAKQNTKRMF